MRNPDRLELLKERDTSVGAELNDYESYSPKEVYELLLTLVKEAELA